VNDLASQHRDATEAVRPIVAAVDASDLARPTPCAGWDVRELLNHIVAGNWWAARLAAGASIDDVGSELDGDQLGGDALGAYERSAEAAATAFEAPGALAAPCAVSYGPVPGAVYAGHRMIDLLVHGVDLADATGQSVTYPPALVDACWAVVDPQLQELQASGAFGEPVTVDPGADSLTRLLGALGRRRP
jgi:uncharacterized protein (TIGR03086 family)